MGVAGVDELADAGGVVTGSDWFGDPACVDAPAPPEPGVFDPHPAATVPVSIASEKSPAAARFRRVIIGSSLS